MGFRGGRRCRCGRGIRSIKQYVRMGEIAFAKMRGEEAKARIAARPGRTAKWTLDRFLFFWDGTPHAANGHWANEYLRQLSYCVFECVRIAGAGR